MVMIQATSLAGPLTMGCGWKGGEHHDSWN
eukprot:COSAG02_NODE_38117_length_433_cov_0.712575_1_plen_29_part_01